MIKDKLPSAISSIFLLDEVLKGSSSLWSKVFKNFSCRFHMQIPPDELVDITNQPPISTNNVAKGIKITLNKWSSVYTKSQWIELETQKFRGIFKLSNIKYEAFWMRLWT